ncbi:MAG: GHKL domain-containing protein, partial [Calditrichaeota bacterium]
IILNFWGWFFIRSLKADILAQLKEQVQITGDIYATQISNRIITEPAPIEDWFIPGRNNWNRIALQNLLYEFKSQSKLEDVFIVSPDRARLIGYELSDSAVSYKSHFALNDDLFREALQGTSPEPELRQFANQYFLTTYSPILDLNGDVVAILVTEAPAELFANLLTFERNLLYAATGALGLILVFATLIFLAVRQLFSIQEELQQQRQLAQLGQMAAMVAHEIRNPLSIIKGAADVLQRQYASEGNEMFNFIPEEIDRLNRLVNEFLQFARQKPLKLEPHHPGELLRSLVQQIKDQRISLEIAENLSPVKMDRDAFRQVMLNIVDNALKSLGEDGQVFIRCTPHQSRSDGMVIEVSDNGCGMSKETLQKIFEPFYSTRATGSGLGMTITKQLVEKMNGSISIESEEGKGTTVKIILPK